MRKKITQKKALRQEAEKIVKEKRPRSPNAAALEDVQRLVHELEVHQVELEMQNEELNQIRIELDRSLRQYIDLYEFAPVGYFTLDYQGTIQRVNLRGERIVGRDRGVLEELDFSSLVDIHDRAAFKEFLVTISTSNKTEKCELRLHDPYRKLIYLYVEASSSESHDNCHLAVIDQTEQKLLEIELRKREIELKVLNDTIQQGVISLKENGEIVYANTAAIDILGLVVDGKGIVSNFNAVIETIHEDGTPFPQKEHPSNVAFKTNRSVENIVMGIRTTKTKEFKWIRIHAVPYSFISEERPDQVICVFEDITPIKLLSTYNTLTAREKDVFLLLVKNVERQNIAEALKISPKTVDKHKEHIHGKLSEYEIKELRKIFS